MEALWQAAPAAGATLLAARFPRTYIDVNRTLDDLDLDPDLLSGPWDAPLNSGAKTRLGFDLVWRNVRAGVPIYVGPLTPEQVRRRSRHNLECAARCAPAASDAMFMNSFRRPALRWACLLLLPLLLHGCAVVMVTGAAASVAVTGASLAVDAGVGAVKLTGRAAGAALDLVIPDGK